MNQPLPASAPPYAGAPDAPRRAFRSLDDALARRRRVRAGPAPRRPGAVGAGGVPGRGRARRVRRRARTPACGCCCPPSAHFDDRGPRARERDPPGQAPARRAIRRLADAGPLVALAALALGVVARSSRRLTGGRRGLLAAAARRGRRRRCCGGRPTRRSASAGVDTSGRIDPVRAVVRRAAAGRRTRGSSPASCCWSRGDRAVRAARRPASAWPATSCSPALLGGRSGSALMIGPWLLRLAVGPDRGARRAGPLPGARRRRRAPARLGAADAGADPEERRRPADGRPAGPRPGARPAAWLFDAPTAPTTPPWPARCARRRPRSRTRTASPVEVVTVGDCDRRRGGCAPLVLAAREAMVNAAKHAGAGTGRRVRRGHRARRSRCSSATAAPGFDLDAGRRRPAGRAQQHPRPDGRGTAARADGPHARPARAPRCGCTCPNDEGDEPMTPLQRRRDRRRPRDVPAGRPRRARHRRSTSSPRPPTSTGGRRGRSTHRPDVVLLDVHLPGGGGVEVMRRTAVQAPDTRFLALSASATRPRT